MAKKKSRTIRSKVKSQKAGGRGKSKSVRAASKNPIPAIVAATRGLRKSAPGLITLDAAERKRLPKPREGAEQPIRLMESLLGRKEGGVAVSGIAPGDLSARWAFAESLAPLRTEVEAFLQAIDDTILKATSEAWAGALDILAVARGVARRDAALAEEISGMERFLALGPRRDAAPEPPPAATANRPTP